jgi:L-seryl-tRNA(Ser) seleniumtransferase
MAIKPADLLNQLPSVSELLEKPPIRALADRWNRSVVAGNVRNFLDEMRSELRRRAADVPVPSVRELAERAARYVVSQQQQSLGTAINATGRIWGAPWANRPLADVALERAFAAGRDFVCEESAESRSAASELHGLICRLSGGQAAVAVHSYTGAVWLALSALATDREVLVSRAEIDEVELAEPLPKIAAAAGATLKEVGTTNRAIAADYEAAVSTRTAALLTLSSDAYRVVGDTGCAELDELVALARDREIPLIDALGAGPLVDPPPTIDWPRRSVRASLAAGAEVAVVRGDGLLGGPPCGILVGSQAVLQRIASHPLFEAWRLDGLRRAALLATLECYADAPSGLGALPVWQIVEARLDNLRNRAERMAPQLARAEGIASSVAVETLSQLHPGLATGYSSYGVALTAAEGDIGSLDRRLRSASVPIVGRIEGDRLVLDMRTVLARQDKIIVDELLDARATGRSAADPEETQPIPS